MTVIRGAWADQRLDS